jgi:hypothetical protein
VIFVGIASLIELFLAITTEIFSAETLTRKLNL